MTADLYIVFFSEQRHEGDDLGDFNNQVKLTPIEVFTNVATSYGLPKYIQNMLVACDYDRLEVIAKMNVDQSSPNDIDNMLSYLNQTYPNDSRLVYVATHIAQFTLHINLSRFSRETWSSSAIDIPPGHRVLLSGFIQETKNEKLRSQISEGTTLNAPAISKPTKKTIAYNVEGLDLADIYSKIRI